MIMIDFFHGDLLLRLIVGVQITSALCLGMLVLLGCIIPLLHLPCSQCYIILLGVEEAERTKASVSDEEERQRRLKTIQRGVERISSQLRNPNSLYDTSLTWIFLMHVYYNYIIYIYISFSDFKGVCRRVSTMSLGFQREKTAGKAPPIFIP